MKLKFIGIASLVLIIYGAINAYIGWNGHVFLRELGIHPPLFWYWLLFAVIAMAYIIGRSPLWQGRATRFLKVVGSYYFAILEFSIILLPIANVTVWIATLGDADSTMTILIVGWVVVSLILILMAWGSWNAWNPIVRKYELEMDKPAGDRKDLRVLAASDIHLGNIVGNRHLKKLVARMNGLQPDLVLLPGDVIDDDIEPFVRNHMAEVLKELKAKLGVYAVLGNHEYYGGHIESYLKEMDAIGIKVLRDEAVLVEDAFYVVGRKDKTAESMGEGGRGAQVSSAVGRLPVHELLAGLDHTRPILLMDHQPYAFEKAAEAGADLMLSGHTHRGQYAPNHLFTRRLFELDWGYMRKGNMHVVVSSGYGTWGPPIRLASRCEIVELIIKFKG